LDPTQDDVREAVDEATGGFGVDVAIECAASAQAMEQAIDSITGTNKHETGTVVSVGAQSEPLKADYWGIREGWLTVSGDHTASDLTEIVSLVESGKVDLSHSISHTFALDEIAEGLEVMRNEADVRRVVLDI
jgi:threonine dehydrogenase-like Zn-dependent dehydrogenase